MKLKMQALSAAIALSLVQAAAAQQSNPQASKGETSRATPGSEAQYSQSMEKLQQAAQRLREAVQAMATQQAGPKRSEAMKQVNDALQETQAAMAQLPPELRQATGDKKSADQAQTKALRDVRLSQLLGKDVRNPQGEDLGEVKDLVIDTSENQVKYAVIEFGGFLGLGEKQFAFPVSAFMQATGDEARAGPRAAGTTTGVAPSPARGDRAVADTAPADRRATEDRGVRAGVWSSSNELVLNVKKERLENAPGFDDKRWPNFSDAGFRGEIDRYWDNQESGSGKEPTAGGDKKASSAAAGKSPKMIKTTTWRASDLLDTKVVGQDGKDIGEIEDIVVNAQSGELRYAVVAFDRGWFTSDKPVAVPADSLTPLSERRVSFSGKKEQLANAPSFDREKWPDLNEPGFRTRMDPYLGDWDRGTDDARKPGGGTAGPGATTTR